MADLPVLPHLARIQAQTTPDALLTLARERGFDPAVFDEFEPFFWTAEISSDRLDAYYTRMMPSSLRNYAADATAGVAFQDSHRTDGLDRTFGHSLTGRYVEAEGGRPAVTLADFYTLRGMDPSIDRFINRVRAGLTRDVSVGFYGGRIVCSICGRDMWNDWDCPHIPGIEYEVKTTTEETGAEQRRLVLAVGLVEDAHLAEVSAVFDGATPGAAILKAQLEARRGRIRPDAARCIEQRYRIHLPDRRLLVPVAAPIQEVAVSEGDTRQILPEPTAELTRQLRALFPDAATDEALVAAVRALKEERDRLAPLADDGRQYRTDLIAEALAEGVRAFGETFAAETYRPILEAAPLTVIKRMRDDWASIGDRRFPGGRLTRDEDETERRDRGRTEVPDAAFRVP